MLGEDGGRGGHEQGTLAVEEEAHAQAVRLRRGAVGSAREVLDALDAGSAPSADTTAPSADSTAASSSLLSPRRERISASGVSRTSRRP